MLNHPHLVLVESDFPTLNQAFEWVEQKCDIKKNNNELITLWSVDITSGIIVLLWRASSQHKKVMTHSRLRYVIEKRDSSISIYQIYGVAPCLLDLKLLSENYRFPLGLTDEQKRQRHLKQMREWHKKKAEERRKNKCKYPPYRGCKTTYKLLNCLYKPK